MAGTWTVGPQPVVWATPPVIGDGSDARGGTPPLFANEPAILDEVGYTRSQWLNNDAYRSDQGEAKFRITLNFAFFATVDPLLHPGMTTMSHHHTFAGNLGLFEALGAQGVADANYDALRNYPKSTASGGPLNSTLYWEPTLFCEIAPGILVPMKPEVISFYYTDNYTEVAKLQRIPRGFTFIGGVDPADRFNTTRLNELPDNQGWDKTSDRLNGWLGWKFFDKDLQQDIPLAAGNTADALPDGKSARQLVNADGSDPWGGAAENPNSVLISTLVGPSWMDGHNFTSPNGRDHTRYDARKSDNSFKDVGPQGWWRIPEPEIKTQFPASRPGLSGHAFRSKLALSSDYDMAGNLVHPRGSTMHFDWMDGWDFQIRKTWHAKCNGIDFPDLTGEPLTCDTSTISATQRMLVTEPSPDPTLSNNPVISFPEYNTGPSKVAFGKLDAGTKVSGIVI